MDVVPDPVGKRIRELTSELGIMPTDPLGPMLEELAKLPHQVWESIEHQLEPYLTRLETVSAVYLTGRLTHNRQDCQRSNVEGDRFCRPAS